MAPRAALELGYFRRLTSELSEEQGATRMAHPAVARPNSAPTTS